MVINIGIIERLNYAFTDGHVENGEAKKMVVKENYFQKDECDRL